MASILSYVAKLGVTVRFNGDDLEFKHKIFGTRHLLPLKTLQDPHALVFQRLQDHLIRHYSSLFPFSSAPASTSGYNMGKDADEFLVRALHIRDVYERHLHLLQYRVATLDEPIGALLDPFVLPPPEIQQHPLSEEVQGAQGLENDVAHLVQIILAAIDSAADESGTIDASEVSKEAGEEEQLPATSMPVDDTSGQLDTIEEQPSLEVPDENPTEPAVAYNIEPSTSKKDDNNDGSGAAKKGGARKKKTTPPEKPGQLQRTFPREPEKLKGFFTRYRDGGGDIPVYNASITIKSEPDDTEEEFIRKCAIIYDYFNCGRFRGGDFEVTIESD